MLDGIELKGRTNVVCLGITTEGQKVPLGLWEGSSENAVVATALLADLVERGLDTAQGVLCVLDGAKALAKAVRDVLGERTPVQRCVRHYADIGISATRSETSSSTCPSATAPPCAGGFAARGSETTTSAPRRSCGCSPQILLLWSAAPSALSPSRANQ